MKKQNIVVVGATGIVGRTLVRILEERRFPVDRLILVAGRRSVGKELPFRGENAGVAGLSEDVFDGADLAFFCAGGDVSGEWIPRVRERCRLVVDLSSVFRMVPDVPLVVPEVNGGDIGAFGSNVIANPNCSTVPLVMVLKPLHETFTVRRVTVSTYQAVSGAGQEGIDQLERELRGGETGPMKFPHPIADNCLPHVDVFLEDGYTKEEHKVINEVRKILHDDSIRVAPTCVRVPVRNCHSESVNIEFENPVSLGEVRELLASSPGVVVRDDPGRGLYPLARIASGKDEVFVGRLRSDPSVEHGIALWIVSDNLRKGAGTNAVQIAEHWMERDR